MIQGIRNVRNLFFVKRLPRLHVPVKWQRPANNAEYYKMIEWEGFIPASSWKGKDLSEFPTLKQDLSDLEEHLLPAFWEFNQKAKHYQNRFYLYQWVFMGGAFLTTLLGATTTYAYTRSADGGTAAQVFGYLTALVSGITAYFNVMSDQGSPQKRWAKTRRLSEELRMNYFKYLSHLAPYDTEDRVQTMRRMIIDIRRKENENV